MAEKEEDKPHHASVGVGQLHKPKAGGVSDPKATSPQTESAAQPWHVALVLQPKYLLKTRETLQKLGYEAYIASYKEQHTYKNRTRREVENILLRGMVFVRVNEKDTTQLLRSCSFIDAFLRNRSGQPNKYGKSPLAIIPDQHMRTMQEIIASAAPGSVSFTDERLKPNSRLRVVQGPLKGMEGGYLHRDGHDQLVLLLDNIGNLLVTVQISDVILL